MDLDFHVASGLSIEDSANFEAGSKPGFLIGLNYSIGDPLGLFLALDGFWTLPVLTSEWVVYRGQLGAMARLGLQYDFGKVLFAENARIAAGAGARIGAYQYTDQYLFYPGVFLGVHCDVLKWNEMWSLTATCDSDLWFRKDLVLALDVKLGAGVKCQW
jgi:hypothetical protein